MSKLDGKIALITGGNSGVGLATAKEFVGEGAYVFITGPRDPELATAVKEIGRSVTGVQGDVSNLRDLDRLFAQIKRDKGRLDIVFANADGAKFAPLGPPLGQITEDHFDSLFDINVKGLLFTVQKALALMPDGASIILNASILAGKGWPMSSVYSATKAVVRSFVRTWTAMLKDRRVRVNAISSGFVATPTWHVSEARRTATSEKVAEAVAFLASEDSSYITGAELVVEAASHRRRSQRQWCFWHPRTAATSPDRNWSWMAASHQCRGPKPGPASSCLVGKVFPLADDS